MTKDEPRYIIAEHEIEEQIRSNFHLLLDAVAKELDSISSDMEWCLNHSPSCVALAEIAANAVAAFHNEAKRCENE